jgi:hypothetical protein
MALLLSSAIPFVLFLIIISLTDNIVFSMIGWIVGLLVGLMVGSWILKHPFLTMLENTEPIAFMVDSTAVIKPVNCYINQPYVIALMENGKEIKTSYDRNIHNYLSTPRTGYYATIDKHRVYTFPMDEISKLDFEFENRSAFLINGMLGTFIPKQLLTDKENSIYVDHSIDYLSRMEEDESREIIKYTQTFFDRILKAPFLKNVPWLLVLIVVIVLAILIYYWPVISVQLGIASNAAGSTINQTAVNLRPATGG